MTTRTVNLTLFNNSDLAHEVARNVSRYALPTLQRVEATGPASPKRVKQLFLSAVADTLRDLKARNKWQGTPRVSYRPANHFGSLFRASQQPIHVQFHFSDSASGTPDSFWNRISSWIRGEPSVPAISSELREKIDAAFCKAVESSAGRPGDSIGVARLSVLSPNALVVIETHRSTIEQSMAAQLLAAGKSTTGDFRLEAVQTAMPDHSITVDQLPDVVVSFQWRHFEHTVPASPAPSGAVGTVLPSRAETGHMSALGLNVVFIGVTSRLDNTQPRHVQQREDRVLRNVREISRATFGSHLTEMLRSVPQSINAATIRRDGADLVVSSQGRESANGKIPVCHIHENGIWRPVIDDFRSSGPMCALVIAVGNACGTDDGASCHAAVMEIFS